MDAERPRHKAQHHLKQMDKIAKTSVVPEYYAKIFKGIKNPAAYIKAANKHIADIETELKEAEEKFRLKNNGKSPTEVAEEIGEDIGGETDDSSGCEQEGIKPTPVSSKKEKEKSVEPESSDTDDGSGVEIELDEGGKKTLMSLRKFKGLIGVNDEG